LLLIGDPHLEGRIPGFRKDDYPRAVLEKLGFALATAAGQELLPLVLGDLFHLPRSNPNWLLVEVMQLFSRQEVFGIYGNHDVHENQLSQDDSISVLAHAGRITLLDSKSFLEVEIGSVRAVIGGTPWGQRLPERLPPELQGLKPDLSLWLAHHDLIVPGYEEQGHFRPKELPGIDLVVNGHIHRCLGEVQTGATRWLTPGNISRRTRSDAAKAHQPSVVRLDVQGSSWVPSWLEVPHRPFEEVFYEAVAEDEVLEGGSAFIAGLAELQARKTQTGAGLSAFLNKNLGQFDPEVAGEIRNLAEEVSENE
jgi:predicted phosphodiesterase